MPKTNTMVECHVYGDGRVHCPFEWCEVDVIAGDTRIVSGRVADYKGFFWVSDEYAGETVEVFVRKTYEERKAENKERKEATA